MTAKSLTSSHAGGKCRIAARTSRCLPQMTKSRHFHVIRKRIWTKNGYGCCGWLVQLMAMTTIAMAVTVFFCRGAVDPARRTRVLDIFQIHTHHPLPTPSDSGRNQKRNFSRPRKRKKNTVSHSKNTHDLLTLRLVIIR